MPGYRWRVVGAACDGALPDVKLMGGNIVFDIAGSTLTSRRFFGSDFGRKGNAYRRSGRFLEELGFLEPVRVPLLYTRLMCFARNRFVSPRRQG